MHSPRRVAPPGRAAGIFFGGFHAAFRFREHLDPAFAPKRILSLDGGGTKGIIEIAFLERIESLLASRTVQLPTNSRLSTTST